MQLKAMVGPFVPEGVRQQWRRMRFEAEQRRYRNRPLADVFEEIYSTHAWDREGSSAPYRSGPGSAAEVTGEYERFIVDYLERHPQIDTLVDIGCGDFQVSGRILDALEQNERAITYIGCDIAANVVAHNRRTHTRAGVRFEVLDATTELPPNGDIVTVREVFQHLSNAHIASALANLAQRFDRAIITESLPPGGEARANVDIVSCYRTRDGYRSGVFIDKPPFSLRVLEEHVKHVTPSHMLRTTVVQLRGTAQHN